MIKENVNVSEWLVIPILMRVNNTFCRQTQAPKCSLGEFLQSQLRQTFSLAFSLWRKAHSVSLSFISGVLGQTYPFFKQMLCTGIEANFRWYIEFLIQKITPPLKFSLCRDLYVCSRYGSEFLVLTAEIIVSTVVRPSPPARMGASYKSFDVAPYTTGNSSENFNDRELMENGGFERKSEIDNDINYYIVDRESNPVSPRTLPSQSASSYL